MSEMTQEERCEEALTTLNVAERRILDALKHNIKPKVREPLDYAIEDIYHAKDAIVRIQRNLPKPPAPDGDNRQ
jgi:hypothetical protein